MKHPMQQQLTNGSCGLLPGDEGKPNIEVIVLVCTGAAATFLWLMLILFIRKLRKVTRDLPAITASSLVSLTLLDCEDI